MTANRPSKTRATRRGGAAPSRGVSIGTMQAASLEYLSQQLREFEKIGQALKSDAANADGRLDQIFAMHGRWWWLFYEEPMQMVGFLLSAIQGWGEQMPGIARQANPDQAFVSYMADNSEPKENAPFEMLSELNQAIFLNGIWAMICSVEAIEYYGASMDELLARAKDGNRKALVNAASIDRMVLATATGTQLLAKAHTSNDTRLLKRVYSGKAPTAKRRSYRLARYMARVVRESMAAGGVTSISSEDLLEVFCNRMRVYPFSADAAKGLRELLRRSKLDATT